MKANKLIRALTAIPLGIAAVFMLIFVPNAHVSMCMVCAIGYSLGLPMEKHQETANKITSFFSGGILFYTVYAGSTFVFLEWLVDGPRSAGLETMMDSAWIYHFFINFALLALFYTKHDKMQYVLGGMHAFMIGAPVMIGINYLTNREYMGGPEIIYGYVLVGLALWIYHRIKASGDPQRFIQYLQRWRTFIIYSLIFYTLLIASMPILGLYL